MLRVEDVGLKDCGVEGAQLQMHGVEGYAAYTMQ